MVAGDDHFKSDVSAWTVLGAGALEREGYTPDFSAYVRGSGPCWCLRFNTRIFEATVDTSVLEGVTLKVGVGSTVVVTGGGGEGWCGGFHDRVYCGRGGVVLVGEPTGEPPGEILVAVPNLSVSKPLLLINWPLP